MMILLDTQLLLWALAAPEKLSAQLRDELADIGIDVLFSAASIWEVAIKFSRGKRDFSYNPDTVRAEAFRIGFRELPITSAQVAKVAYLPQIHRDPFDRLLVAQAQSTGYLLCTTDPIVAKYPGPIRLE